MRDGERPGARGGVLGAAAAAAAEAGGGPLAGSRASRIGSRCFLPLLPSPFFSSLLLLLLTKTGRGGVFAEPCCTGFAWFAVAGFGSQGDWAAGFFVCFLLLRFFFFFLPPFFLSLFSLPLPWPIACSAPAGSFPLFSAVPLGGGRERGDECRLTHGHGEGGPPPAAALRARRARGSPPPPLLSSPRSAARCACADGRTERRRKRCPPPRRQPPGARTAAVPPLCKAPRAAAWR